MDAIELTRRERKKSETRRRITDVAIRLFRERGFESTTIDDITEAADVGRGTFFNYFPRKEAVLGYHLDCCIIPSEEVVRSTLEDPRPTRERLIQLYVGAASFFERDPELSRFVVRETLQRSFAEDKEHDMVWSELVQKLVAQGVERGEIRPDVDARRVNGLLTSVFIGTLLTWLFRADDSPRPAFELPVELKARMHFAFEGLGPQRRPA